MTYYWVIPLAAAVLSFALGIFVWTKTPRSKVSGAFAVLTAMLTLWNLNFFVLYFVADRSLAFAVTRVLRTGAAFLPPSILCLILALRNRRSSLWRAALVLDYALAALLGVANVFDMLVTDLRRFAWGYYSVGTPLYSAFSVFLLVNLFTVGVLLVKDYLTVEDPRTRVQLKFWLFGAGIAIPLGCTNLLPAYGVPVYPLGNLGTAAWAGIVAYAIVRHRLMDIDLVISSGVAYAAVSLVLIAPAFGLVLGLQQISFGGIHTDFSFAVLLMLITVGVLFPTLRLQAQARIEQSLFREKHEYREALRVFTRSIVRILDRERLLRELASTLSETLRLDRMVIALHDEAGHLYTVRSALGIPPATDEIADTDDFIVSLGRRQGAVLRDELRASRDPAEKRGAAEVCERNGWEVCIPLTAGGKLTGFIGLGRKRNLDAFFAEDLNLLETLAAQVSVALENARLYEELKKSQDIIRRSDRLSAIGTLAAGIAHEIRNPLVSIQTFFQLAPQRMHDREFLTEFLRLTSGEVKRITDLISELLSFARSPTPSRTEVNLNELIDKVTRLVEPQVRTGQIEIHRELAADLPLTVGDPEQLKQVLLNILLNATQAIDRGGGTITVTSRAVTHQAQPLCQVQIRDTGKGIPEEVLDHIFDPFFTTKEKGTGLGLAIAYQMVSEHGGFVTVESRVGAGTTVSIHLPLPPPGGEAALESEAPRRAVGGRMKVW